MLGMEALIVLGKAVLALNQGRVTEAADNLRAAARNIAEVLRIGGGLSAGRSEADGREPTP